MSVTGGYGGGGECRTFLKNAKLNVINPEVRRTQNDEFISSTCTDLCGIVWSYQDIKDGQLRNTNNEIYSLNTSPVRSIRPV